MKITDIKFGMLRVPLKTPFKTALRTVDTVEDVVVLVHTDSGHIGYGEAPATAVIMADNTKAVSRIGIGESRGTQRAEHERHDHGIDNDVQQREHPELLAPRTPLKIGEPLQRQNHPFHV